MNEHNLHSIAFPTLNEEQISKLATCTSAEPRRYRGGETLWATGELNINFYIVKSGEVEILDTTGDQPKRITMHHPGEFTGDISHLTGLPAIVTGVANGDCEVYEISAASLRRVLNQCPTVSDIILQAFIARRQLLRESPDFTGLRVIGSRYSPDTFRVRDFLAKNRILFTWIDVETDPNVGQLLKRFGVTEADTPVVSFAGMMLLRNPSNVQLAEAIGIRQPLEDRLYDLVVVGGGPAGLAAAVYGASEGLQTAVLEHTAPGGQAGSSMRIENYLGFPTGLTGSELAGRAILQANKFGVHLSVPSRVNQLAFENGYTVVKMDDGQSVTAKCLLIASGADYRRLDVEGCERFEGTGVYYAATVAEGQLCTGADVIVVGGGNSAGQAAVFLSQHARSVMILIRGDDLYKSMSSYLVHRIEQTPNIKLVCGTTIRRLQGDTHVHAAELVNHKTGEERTVPVQGVFSFIGADPRTAWLPEEIERDAKGFVRTGGDVAQSPAWKGRPVQPFLLETSRPGVFAAGDVRSGSVKRVASAVGEGSMAVQFVHERLKHM
ncbi:MAG: FAD-dependent oxidoreductase [Candidatus Solibacter sp.]